MGPQSLRQNPTWCSLTWWIKCCLTKTMVARFPGSAPPQLVRWTGRTAPSLRRRTMMRGHHWSTDCLVSKCQSTERHVKQQRFCHGLLVLRLWDHRVRSKALSAGQRLHSKHNSSLNIGEDSCVLPCYWYRHVPSFHMQTMRISIRHHKTALKDCLTTCSGADLFSSCPICFLFICQSRLYCFTGPDQMVFHTSSFLN